MCLDWFKKTNEDSSKLTGKQVRSLLKKEFGSQCEIHISDEYYLKDTKKALIEFLAKDDTDELVFNSVITDCDDFSFRLMGNAAFGKLEGTAFGILWTKTTTGAHAINLFIDENHIVWLIEPQTDNIYLLPEGWEPMLVVM